jgi:uncharacterized protein
MSADFVALSDLPLTSIVGLNNAHAVELAFADAPRMQFLLNAAWFAKGTADAAAFLIAFDQMSDYDSENFLWFKARYPRFIYVDRVVVAAAARGQGVARQLYETLFESARAANYPCVVCEVNSDPPNPASDAFHAALGFNVVAARRLNAGNKSVRYLHKLL